MWPAPNTRYPQLGLGAEPEHQNTTGEEWNNVRAQVGADTARGAGGSVAIVGNKIKAAGQATKEVLHALFPGTDVPQVAEPVKDAGDFVSRQGDYLVQGAEDEQRTHPVQTQAGKLGVGVGGLAADAAVGYVTGGPGFLASFAIKSAGNMYANSLAQGESREVATNKGLIAGGVAVLATRLRAKINLSGWAPEPHQGYYPRSRNRAQGAEAGIPEGWRGYMNRALENISSMEQREQDVGQPLRIKGFIGRAFDHFEDTAKLIHLAEPVRNAAAVWQHPKTAKAVSQRFGESMNERVAQFLGDTMMVRAAPPPGMVSRAWQTLGRNFARAWLQLNPSPMLKNVVGGPIALLPEFDHATGSPA